jgi:hypothetical protein
MISVVGKVMASPAAIGYYKNGRHRVFDVDRVVGRCHRPTISSRVWHFGLARTSNEILLDDSVRMAEPRALAPYQLA